MLTQLKELPSQCFTQLEQFSKIAFVKQKNKSEDALVNFFRNASLMRCANVFSFLIELFYTFLFQCQLGSISKVKSKKRRDFVLKSH